MKKINLVALLGLPLLTMPESRAGTFAADFNSGATPLGAALFGNNGDNASGVIELTGGAGDTGCLKLTKAVGSKNGTMIINDLDAGNFVNSFTSNFKVRIGGGTVPPADGFAFCFASDLPDGAFGEAGAGSGLTVALDIYDNPDGAPAFKISVGGLQVATTGVLPIATMATNTFVDMMVRMNPTGTLDVTYNGQAIFTNLATAFQPVAGGRFGFGARTGGATANHFIDDISITTSQGQFVQPLIVRAPLTTRIIAGYPALMNVRINALVNPVFQWEKKGPAAAGFSPIAGAVDAVYISPASVLADAGTQYRVIVSNENGDSVTSEPATIDVVALPHATPDTVSFNFDSGSVPAGSNAFGTAAVFASGGFNNSGYMSLTEDLTGIAGTWLVDDQNAGGPVGSIDVAFKLRLTPAEGAVPADGFGFHWAPDLPEIGFTNAEEPVGTGLSVGFDVYNNGNNEAPAVDVFWLGTRLGGTAVPAELLNTMGAMVDVQIRLSPAGLVDVSFNGVVLVYQLQIPNWTAFSGARYGFAARTGGLSEEQSIDEVRIKSTAYAGAIGFVSQPQPATRIPGNTATFSVTSNAPLQSTFQWQLSTGGGAFSNIGGATNANYTTPVLAFSDNGNQYRCHLTSNVNASTADSTPALLTVYNLTGPVAPQIFDTFNNGTDPDNTGTVPAAVQTLSGNYNFGYGPFLALTDNATGQFGTVVIDDFNSAQPVGGFTAAMKVQITGANPADGWSFSWGTAIAPDQIYGNLESGLGNDLRVSFYTYAGSGVSVRVNWRGTEIANLAVPLDLLQTPLDTFEDVIIRVTPVNGATPAFLDVAQEGKVIIQNLALPGLTGISGASFALAARTGGASELHAYDDLAISTSLYVGPISLSSQPPASFLILAGKTLTLTVASTNPPQTTYQWQRAEPGSATFANIAGATSASYATPLLTSVADSGAAYQCVCTGPSNVVTSTPSVLTVVDPGLPASFEVAIPFTNGEYPVESAIFGTASGLPDGGVDGTGTMSLTAASNDQNGAFVLSDLDGGAAVDGFVANFQLLIGTPSAGNATAPPADGVGFVWSREVITAAFGESGTGTGLIISFDTYDNDDANPDNAAGEAPAIEAIWNSSSLGNIRVPRSLMESGLAYNNVIVRVNPGGTLDVIFGDTVIFWHMPLPGYAPIAGGNFGWGGRTGGANAEQNVDNINLTTFASTAGPTISFSESGGNVIITFTGVLESSDNLINWTAMPAQPSPLVVPKASLTGRLYLRARK